MNLYLKITNILSDIYENHVDNSTVRLAKEIEVENRDAWQSVSAIRYVAGSDNRTDWDNVAQEARYEIEDDLIFPDGSYPTYPDYVL